jgi:hypothetical protein
MIARELVPSSLSFVNVDTPAAPSSPAPDAVMAARHGAVRRNGSQSSSGESRCDPSLAGPSITPATYLSRYQVRPAAALWRWCRSRCLGFRAEDEHSKGWCDREIQRHPGGAFETPYPLSPHSSRPHSQRPTDQVSAARRCPCPSSPTIAGHNSSLALRTYVLVGDVGALIKAERRAFIGTSEDARPQGFSPGGQPLTGAGRAEAQSRQRPEPAAPHSRLVSQDACMAACSIAETARSSSSRSHALTAMSPVARRMPWPAVRSASCWHVLVLRGLLGVLDLPDPLPLGRIGDVLRLLPPNVARRLVGTDWCVEKRERATGGRRRAGQAQGSREGPASAATR